MIFKRLTAKYPNAPNEQLPTQKAMRYQPGGLILAGDECSAALPIDDDDNHGEYVHYHGQQGYDGRDDEPSD